jgi:very-short-patch-repair endonuclease
LADFEDNLHRLAREMRHEPTRSESILWVWLQRGRLGGLKFRRQRPIDRFIADFCCDSLRLIVEIDGSVHDTPDQRETDAIREAILTALGYTVIRFTADEVEQNPGDVARRILMAAQGIQQKSLTNPSR